MSKYVKTSRKICVSAFYVIPQIELKLTANRVKDLALTFSFNPIKAPRAILMFRSMLNI